MINYDLCACQICVNQIIISPDPLTSPSLQSVASSVASTPVSVLIGAWITGIISSRLSFLSFASSLEFPRSAPHQKQASVAVAAVVARTTTFNHQQGRLRVVSSVSWCQWKQCTLQNNTSPLFTTPRRLVSSCQTKTRCTPLPSFFLTQSNLDGRLITAPDSFTDQQQPRSNSSP